MYMEVHYLRCSPVVQRSTVSVCEGKEVRTLQPNTTLSPWMRVSEGIVFFSAVAIWLGV